MAYGRRTGRRNARRGAEGLTGRSGAHLWPKTFFHYRAALRLLFANRKGVAKGGAPLRSRRQLSGSAWRQCRIWGFLGLARDGREIAQQASLSPEIHPV